MVLKWYFRETSESAVSFFVKREMGNIFFLTWFVPQPWDVILDRVLIFRPLRFNSSSNCNCINAAFSRNVKCLFYLPWGVERDQYPLPSPRRPRFGGIDSDTSKRGNRTEPAVTSLAQTRDFLVDGSTTDPVIRYSLECQWSNCEFGAINEVRIFTNSRLLWMLRRRKFWILFLTPRHHCLNSKGNVASSK